jgi:DNA-binding CsgD family transcriptional regulator
MNGPRKLEDRCLECLLFGAIEGLEEGMVLAHPDGRVFMVNRRAEELLDLPAAAAVGAPIRTVLQNRRLLDFWAAASRDDQPTVMETTLPPSRAVRVSAALCRGAAGEVIGRALQLRDISRERRVQVELSTSVARRLVEMAGGDEADEEMPSLTRREDEILRLLAAGLSNAAIASRLGVSVNTVASHLKHLYPKLGVANRSQATAFALSHGIHPAMR